MFSRFNSNKCKTQAKMCISRIKLMRNKRQIGLRQLRREVADLMKQGKQGNARIRVEAVIRENFMLQAYDIVELFLELISVRVALMEKSKDMPADMSEAICSIIYAGDRMSTDLPEMAIIRTILINKYSPVYGKEFAMEASSELSCRKWHVNENLVSCLLVEAPPAQEKIRMLAEIAAEHEVDFDESAAAADMLTGPAARPQAAAATPFPVMAESAAPYPPAALGAPPPWAPQPGSPGAYPPIANAPGFAPPAAGMAPPPVAAQQPPAVGGAMGPGWAPVQQQPAQTGGFQGHVTSVGNWFKAKKSGSPPKDGAGYQDASAAAEAARQYSAMAQQAADAAEQYARTQGGAPGTPPAAGGGSGAGSGAGSPGGSAGGSGGPPRFVRRSDSEIQRAYDAAVGPPSKGELAASGPPSAPPQPPSGGPPTGPLGAGPSAGIAGARPADAPVAAAPGGDEDLGLPSAPTSLKPPAGGGGGGGDEVDKELDELNRRLEALKRR